MGIEFIEGSVLDTVMTTKDGGCEKCGKCCKQGGPALHKEDLPLVRSGKLPISCLITIRKGELAHNPVSGVVQPVSVELVKITGSGRQWDCCYYDSRKGCTIYEHRPQACRTLKCWDTDEILALVEKDTLSRFDILPEDHFILPALREHERICPLNALEPLYRDSRNVTDKIKKTLEKQAREEMRFRMRLVNDYQLKISDELFYFGRPFFQLLQALGVKVSESPQGICLHWD